MITNYKLTITQKGPKADKSLKNEFKEENLRTVLSRLAGCFRDLNRSERAHNINRAKYWRSNPYNEPEAKEHFIIEYDIHLDGSVIVVYEYEFNGIL